MVRAAAVSIRGVSDLIDHLIAESHDPEFTPPERAEPADDEQEVDIDWPPHQTRLYRGRKNIQGEQAPDLSGVDYLTSKPEMENALVVLDFWATWCKPCRDAMPHMNRLAQKFPGDVAVVGLTSEGRADVEQFLRTGQIEYAVGLDPDGAIARAAGVRGIPDIVIVSRDGVVRWQGHPNLLTEQVLTDLVRSNRLLPEEGGGASEAADSGISRGRWTGGAGS